MILVEIDLDGKGFNLVVDRSDVGVIKERTSAVNMADRMFHPEAEEYGDSVLVGRVQNSEGARASSPEPDAVSTGGF